MEPSTVCNKCGKLCHSATCRKCREQAIEAGLDALIAKRRATMPGSDYGRATQAATATRLPATHRIIKLDRRRNGHYIV